MTDKNDNENCLDGLECPACGHHTSLKITVLTTVTFTDDGSGDDYDGWEYDYPHTASCPACNHTARLQAFMIDKVRDCCRGGSILFGGLCSDTTCPFSDHRQYCPVGWVGHPDHPNATEDTQCTCHGLWAVSHAASGEEVRGNFPTEDDAEAWLEAHISELEPSDIDAYVVEKGEEEE